MIRWFKTRRALVNMLDERGHTIANRDETITYLNDVMAQGAATDGARIARLQKSLDHALYTAGFEHKLRVSAEERLAVVVEELHKLREDIRREEQAEQSVGIMRTHNRPMPWQQHDAIQQDAEAKRSEDI